MEDKKDFTRSSSDEPKPCSVTCSRCNKRIDSEFDPRDTTTAGFYYVGAGGWVQFSRPGEEFVCDECMLTSPEYRAVYGNRILII